MGPSRIVFFELLIGEDSLDIKQGGYAEVPLHFGDFQKVLNRFKGGKPSSLSLSYDDNIFTIKGKVSNKTKTFRMRAIDIDYEDKALSIKSLLKLPLDAIFKINVSDFLDGIKDCEIYEACITIRTNDNNIILTAISLIGDVETTINLESEIYSNQIASYSIHFLKKILESTYNMEVVIMFRKDYPIAIHDKISETSRMIWFLAPRVENDDD